MCCYVQHLSAWLFRTEHKDIMVSSYPCKADLLSSSVGLKPYVVINYKAFSIELEGQTPFLVILLRLSF